MYIWVLLWIISIFYGLKICISENLGESLNYSNTLPIRGICSIEILFGHMCGHLMDDRPVYIEDRMGVLIVGVFFLFSGWGLYESIENKKDYFQNFLGKHIYKIMLPVCTIYLLCSCILGQKWKFTVFVNWYVWELLVLYCIFYFLYKWLKPQMANIFLFILMVLFIIIATYAQIGSKWYGSTLCFLAGLLLSQKKDQISEMIRRRFKGMVVGSCLGFIVSIIMFVIFEDKIWGNTFFICLSALLFCGIVVCALMFIRVGNKFTCFLGIISYEIFIIHPSLLVFWKEIPLKCGDLLYGMAVIFSTIVISYLVHKFTKHLTEYFQ